MSSYLYCDIYGQIHYFMTVSVFSCKLSHNAPQNVRSQEHTELIVQGYLGY